jgi:DNA-directed RNA polymerase subunit M/transcription elongation factor TFIIS
MNGADQPSRSGVRFPCASCGSLLVFSPESQRLRCASCGSEQAIPSERAAIEELDLDAALADRLGESTTVETLSVTCESCGASSTLDPSVESDRCPFCGTPFVATALSRRALRPNWLLPFRVGLQAAAERFRAWVSSLWFAPNRLKREAAAGKLSGIYIPYWTFDADARTRYTGQRGDDYFETETYTEIENGRPVTRTRQVVRTRWSPASGSVDNHFDDVLVVASRSLPGPQADALEPWDTDALVPYRDEFLSGFRSECYQVTLHEGFERAKAAMHPEILATIRRDIGGDRQQVSSAEPVFSNRTFKHLLLPIWISSYRYRGKTYRFLVNARSGEVQGERPWSWIKIALAALLALSVLVIVVRALG